MPDVQCTLFDGPLVFRCVFSVKPGLMSRAAGSVWHPARTRFHQQVSPVRGYRLQGTVSHVEGVTAGLWSRGSASLVMCYSHHDRSNLCRG